MGLLQLPSELLLYMADFLPRPQDIYCLILTSRHFRDNLGIFLYQHNIKHWNSSALLWAASRGRADIIQIMMRFPDCNLETNSSASLGRTPLIKACQHGHLEVVQLLLSALNHDGSDVRVDVNAQGYRGDTALAAAAKENHTAIMQLLLNNKHIDVNLPNMDGQTPLAQAVISGAMETTSLLLKMDSVIPDAPDNGLWTPLTFAAAEGHLEIVKLLLLQEGKVDINAQDQSGMTPLMWAVKRGVGQVVDFLLGRDDVDRDLRDRTGDTAFGIALDRNKADMAVRFLEAGAVNPGRNHVDSRNTPDMSAEDRLSEARRMISAYWEALFADQA